MKKLADARMPFERIVVSRELAREMFTHNPNKLAMLDIIPANEVTACVIISRKLTHVSFSSLLHTNAGILSTCAVVLTFQIPA